jgi:phosphomannomutase/phosphoglucomutase
MGAEVIEMDTALDWTFPKYNPNPKTCEMLHDMAACGEEARRRSRAGLRRRRRPLRRGRRQGEEIFADKIGLMLARDLSREHKNATFVVDVKSTGLYATDPVLKANGAKVDYWKTGHSYIKRRTAELKALAGFEKSGHFFFRAAGLGYDDGIVAAAAVLADAGSQPGKTLSQLKNALPKSYTSLTMSPHCDDEKKYGIVDRVVADYQRLASEGGKILGRKIAT